jgi:hypothetical protein
MAEHVECRFMVTVDDFVKDEMKTFVFMLRNCYNSIPKDDKLEQLTAYLDNPQGEIANSVKCHTLY